MFVINYIDETTLTRERVTEINASTNTLYAEVSTNFFFTAHIPCVSGDVVRGRYWSPISTYNVVIHKTDGTNVYASTLWTIDSSSRTKYGSAAWRAFMFTCPANTEYIIYNGLISELGVRAIVTINQDFPDTFVRGNTSANIDKTTLNTAITNASTNLNSVSISVNGSNIATTSYWITQSTHDTYASAISAAQSEYSSTSSTPTKVDSTVSALASATTTFNNNKALGTKSQTQGSYVEEQSPNLLILDCTSKTQYGVTFTVDLVNGKVTLNGTATTPFTHGLNSTPISVTKGDYKCINFGSTKAFTVSFKWTNSDNSIGSANLSTSPSYMITTAKLDGYFTSYVSISRGETFDNTVIKPFVYKGTYVARDFYVGGKINGIERSTQNGYLMANVFNKMNLNPNNFLKGIMSMPILTWIDDDFTTNYRKPDGALKANHGNVESVYEMCNSLGIKCTFAPMVGEFKTLPNAVTLAKQYHSKGFHFALHDGFWEEILWYQQNGFFDFQYNVAPGGAKTLAYQLSISQWAECNVNAGGIAKYNGNAENGRYNLERVFCNGAVTDLATLKTAIDRTIVNGGWLIMGTHSNGWTNPNGSSWNYDITKAVLQYALDNGIKILPLNQAYRLRKPIYDFYDLYKGVMFNDGTLDASL